MDQKTQVQLTKEIFYHLEAQTTCLAQDMMTNPITSYTSADRFQLEKQILFRKYPLLMGLSCQLQKPGDYLTDDYSGVPILVVRTQSGQVKAYINVCRHRGAKLVSGCGNSKRRFTCPYHAWSYDHDGKLVGIPDKVSFEGLDEEQRGLKPLPVVEKYGLIWVQPSPGEAIDIDASLYGLEVDLANYGFENYHHYETRVIQQKMNWKMPIDTFLEPYHFAILHKNTVGPIFFPNLCLFHSFGPNLRETLPRRSITDLHNESEANWDLVKHTALVYILFPNTALIVQADHIEIWRVYPLEDQIDQCVMYLDFYIPEPADTESAQRHWERNMDLTVRTVLEEDFLVGEDIQLGFSSGAQEELVYGRNEPALIHYQKAIAAALNPPLS